MIWQNAAFWYAWFHKGNSATPTDLWGKWRQHPSELKYWRRLSCAWFDKMRHFDMHDFTKEIQSHLPICGENQSKIYRFDAILPERYFIVRDDTLLTNSWWHIAHTWRMTHASQIVKDESLPTLNSLWGMTHVSQVSNVSSFTNCERWYMLQLWKVGCSHKSNEELRLVFVEMPSEKKITQKMKTVIIMQKTNY